MVCYLICNCKHVWVTTEVKTRAQNEIRPVCKIGLRLASIRCFQNIYKREVLVQIHLLVTNRHVYRKGVIETNNKKRLRQACSPINSTLGYQHIAKCSQNM